MTDRSDHEYPPSSSSEIGIPRPNEFDPVAFEQAVSDMLKACGIAPDITHMGRTAQRVRALWQQRLLGGYDLDAALAFIHI